MIRGLMLTPLLFCSACRMLPSDSPTYLLRISRSLKTLGFVRIEHLTDLPGYQSFTTSWRPKDREAFTCLPAFCSTRHGMQKLHRKCQIIPCPDLLFPSSQNSILVHTRSYYCPATLFMYLNLARVTPHCVWVCVFVCVKS